MRDERPAAQQLARRRRRCRRTRAPGALEALIPWICGWRISLDDERGPVLDLAASAVLDDRDLLRSGRAFASGTTRLFHVHAMAARSPVFFLGKTACRTGQSPGPGAGRPAGTEAVSSFKFSPLKFARATDGIVEITDAGSCDRGCDGCGRRIARPAGADDAVVLHDLNKLALRPTPSDAPPVASPPLDRRSRAARSTCAAACRGRLPWARWSSRTVPRVAARDGFAVTL